MASTTYDDPRKQLIDDRIRCIQDYPKPGVAFQDITTILLDPKAFQACIDIMAEHYADKKIDVICGARRRGGRGGWAARAAERSWEGGCGGRAGHGANGLRARAEAFGGGASRGRSAPPPSCRLRPRPVTPPPPPIPSPPLCRL